MYISNQQNTFSYFKEIRLLEKLNCEFIVKYFDNFEPITLFNVGCMITEYCQVRVAPPKNQISILLNSLINITPKRMVIYWIELERLKKKVEILRNLKFWLGQYKQLKVSNIFMKQISFIEISNLGINSVFRSYYEFYWVLI